MHERYWVRVQLHLPQAQVMAAHIMTEPLTGTDQHRIFRKGEKGWLEHGGGIRQFTREQFLASAREEFDDALYYLAAMLGHPPFRER